jgi:hypothetical protein
MIRPTKDIPETSDIEIVATQKTKTVSGKSDLTYHLGKDDDANIYVRIWVNSSNGFFNNEWVPLSATIELLEKQADSSFTSFVFESLFKGKSVNTPGFLVAALLNEGFLSLEEGKKRKYLYASAVKLLATIDKAKPRKTVKKVARKLAVKAPTTTAKKKTS